MSDPTLQAKIDAAMAYEALMVPALFGQWASKVADAAQIRPGQRVLDVALLSWWKPTSGGLPVMGVVLAEEQIARILEEAERDLSAYVTADGTAAFDTSAHIVTGKKR